MSAIHTHAGIDVGLSIEDGRWREHAGITDRIAQAIAAAFVHAGSDAQAHDGQELQVSVLLACDARLRALNAAFRGQDKATNVLSFPAAPLTATPSPAISMPASAVLGDIALAYDTVAREALEQGKGMADHAVHLAIHGLLHLLGHDHQEEHEAEAMEALERAILAHLGIADPYADLDADPHDRMTAGTAS